MDEKKKLAATIAVVAVVVLALVGLLAWQFRVLGVAPLDHPQSLNAQIKATEASYTALRQKLDVEMPAAVAKKEKLEGLRSEAEQLLPVGVASEELLEFVRAKADKSLVDLLSTREQFIAPGRDPRSAGVPAQEIALKVTLDASFDELVSFINYLEMFEMPGDDGKPIQRFFAVKNIEVTAKDMGMVESNTPDARHKVNLTLSTYKYKPPVQGRGRR